MLFIKIISLALLLTIFFQDWKDRAVYWFLFPLLAADLTYLHLYQPAMAADLLLSVAVNIGFLTVQIILLTAWFSVQQKKWINITSGLLGIGDILFLLTISFYLSALNFLIFYVFSLLLILTGWVLWQSISRKKHTFIPLAGLQALLTIALLSCDWWYKPLSLTSDAGLFNMLIK